MSSPAPELEPSPASGYTLLVEIVEFIRLPPYGQESAMRRLLSDCAAALQKFQARGYSLYPTGDGLYITLPEVARLQSSEVRIPMDLAISILKAAHSQNLSLRVAVNYCATDRLVTVENPDAAGDGISSFRVGSGLAICARIVHFAERREIILSESFFNQLSDSGLAAEFGVFLHKSVFVKYLGYIKIYSYRPPQEQYDFIYMPPTKKEGEFKKFAYFPPLETETADRFREIGLRSELQHLLEYTYDTIAAINEKGIFVSWGNVTETIKKIQSDRESEILVLSRSDRRFDFWSTPEAKRYLEDLVQDTHGRKVAAKQIRVFVYDPQLRRPIVESDVAQGLAAVHRRPETLLQIDREYVNDNLLMKYLFGVTIFPALGCAVAPLPWPRSYGEYADGILFSKPEDMFTRYSDAEIGKVSFKALVITNAGTVERLVTAFKALQHHPRTSELTPGE